MKSFLKSDIAIFLLKVICIYLVWYMVYEVWVLPSGVIDEPLSKNIASVSAGIVHFLGEDVFYYGRVVGIIGTPGGEIVDGCNGIAAIGLFLGFIFAYPGAWMPRIFFSIFGIAVIYLINITRIVVLTFTQFYWPEAYDFMHDYSTTTIFYIAIFILWVVWANFGDPAIASETKKQPAPATV